MTQRRIGTYLLIFITTFLISGAFLFNTPKPVFAKSMTETVSTQNIPMTPQMSCNQGGCTQVHNTCDKHCVQEPIQTTIIYAIAPHTETFGICLTFSQKCPQYHPDQTFQQLILLSPPAHHFLRSVIQRE